MSSTNRSRTTVNTKRKRDSVRDFAVITGAVVGLLVNMNLGLREDVSFGWLWQSPPLWLYRLLGGLIAFVISFTILYGVGVMAKRTWAWWRR